VGGHWSSERPFLSAAAKQTDTPWDAGLALALVVLDVLDLKVGGGLPARLPACPPTHDALPIAWCRPAGVGRRLQHARHYSAHSASRAHR
jgi:hypothetical protein